MRTAPTRSIENGRSSVYALRILSNLRTTLLSSTTSGHSIQGRRTNMRLSTASCLVPATERTCWCTVVMEYPNFSLIDMHQYDGADYTNVRAE